MNQSSRKPTCVRSWKVFLAFAALSALADPALEQSAGSAVTSQSVFKPAPDREGDVLPFDAKISGDTQPPASPMSWWYRSPATKFWEGLPLGTGRFAAMVYGRVRDEIIPFNDETLWTGQPYDAVNPAGLKSLPEIRRLALAGQFAEATAPNVNVLSTATVWSTTYDTCITALGSAALILFVSLNFW